MFVIQMKNALRGFSAPVMATARKLSDRKIDDVYLFEQSNGAAAYYMVEYKQETPFSTRQINILANGTILSAF